MVLFRIFRFARKSDFGDKILGGTVRFSQGETKGCGLVQKDADVAFQRIVGRCFGYVLEGHDIGPISTRRAMMMGAAMRIMLGMLGIQDGDSDLDSKSHKKR